MAYAQDDLKQMIQKYSYFEAEGEGEAFTLASGKKSLHYFDLKKTLLLPSGFSVLGHAMWEFFIALDMLDAFDGMGGLTLGADPLTYAMALASVQGGQEKYPLLIRKEAKGHGSGKRIEGYVDRCRRVLALDDVVTTGGSTLEAVKALRQQGLEVATALALVDRKEGGGEALAEEGVELLSLFTVEDFRRN